MDQSNIFIAIRNKLSASLVALFCIILFPTALHAQSVQAFQCDPGFYQVISGQLAEFNPGTGEYAKIGPDYSNYNAMGYRLDDGLLYAVSGSNLYRIDAEGNRVKLTDLDLVSGAYTGDFGDDGLLHISRGGRDWHKVNVDTFEVTAVPELSDYTSVADITNVHGKFYGSSSDGTLYIYDPVALTVTTGGTIQGLPETLNAYGAAWSTAGGNLYIGRNTGDIYQITGYSSVSPVATQVGTAEATSSNDGASCSLAPVPAGLNDVDGPEPETEPSTPEALLATESYIESFDEIALTFSSPVKTETSNSEPTEVVIESESSVTVEDASIGQGPSCGPSEDVDRPQRLTFSDVYQTSVPDVIFSTSFDETVNNFEYLSGSWIIDSGNLKQLNTCGFDYTALMTSHFVDNFQWEVNFSSINEVNQGGILFHQSSTVTRSGAVLVDLSDGGSSLRWGEYDTNGYYVNLGSTSIDAPLKGQTVNLSVVVHGSQVELFKDGVAVAQFTTSSSAGMVGLVSSESDIAFESVELTALPAKETK